MAAVLVVVVVLNKSKTICAPRFVVLFNVTANLFCTVGRFAPFRRWWWCWRGWLAARAAWQGDTPLMTGEKGTISRFSLQKFFFGFRVALGQCRLAKPLAYVIECV